SPPFERNALRAEGILNVPQEWRRADLVGLSKSASTQIPRPMLSSIEGDKWTEESLLSVRIRIREHSSLEFDDPTLVSFVHGDVLPSPSRRDGRRPLVDVWTSGNRVFAC